MTTKFSDIYPLFLSQIDDYELAVISDEEMDSVLLKHLMNAVSSLQGSMIDLNQIDVEKRDFNSELSFIEKSLYTKAMKLEWVREKKYSAELMQKSMGDRDFTAVQGYHYLKELNNVEKDLAKQIKEELIEYSYREEFISDWIR